MQNYSEDKMISESTDLSLQFGSLCDGKEQAVIVLAGCRLVQAVADQMPQEQKFFASKALRYAADLVDAEAMEAQGVH